MPRQARIDSPGLLHHVMARGMENRKIFFSTFDYKDFLDRFEEAMSRCPTQVLAWALMPNHIHLLLRSGPGGIAPLMRRVMTGYVVSFNLRHKRTGHLFKNRYKSIICEEDPHLLELVRYIHLNPVRAGIVKSLSDLDHHPHTGHSALMGHVVRSWQETDDVLAAYSANRSTARARYVSFLADGLKSNPPTHMEGGGLVRSQGGVRVALSQLRSGQKEAYDSRILGSGAFVESVLKQFEDDQETEVRLKRAGIGIQEMARRIAEETGVPATKLFERDRTMSVSRAKSLLIHLGVEYLGETTRRMALLTKMSDPAASKAKQRGATLFRHTTLPGWLKVN